MAPRNGIERSEVGRESKQVGQTSVAAHGAPRLDALVREAFGAVAELHPLR
jgi:hypothetical protein